MMMMMSYNEQTIIQLCAPLDTQNKCDYAKQKHFECGGEQLKPNRLEVTRQTTTS